MNTLGMITIVVDDYDAAISHYVDDLGFSLLEDTPLTPEKRWVVVEPSKSGAKILLAKATTDQQRISIGNSTGGRVAFFLYTTEFEATYRRYVANGVKFLDSPRHEAYGQVVVFLDKYGNKWDLIER